MHKEFFMVRAHGRAYDQLRPIKIEYDAFGYATASVLFTQGKTKVLCSITLQNTVPPFLKGKKTGWLTAEYAMLPTATHLRKERDTYKPNGRSIEISRLIGRTLRSIVELDKLGERTIIVDCDVIQADGSTRTACISGASIALRIAVNRWIKSNKLSETIIREDCAAVSIGLVGSQILLDLDFNEDAAIDADFNFVITRSGKIIEIQGSAEKHPIDWSTIETMQTLALKGINEIFQAVQHNEPHSHEHIYKQPFNGIRVNKEI